jgi:adenylate kinase family enzyme
MATIPAAISRVRAGYRCVNVDLFDDGSSAAPRKTHRSMKRVVVTGNAGGGKTTLSKRLAGATGLPLIFLDQIMWKPGWRALPLREFAQIHRELIDEDEWIIEGVGYDETLEPRFERADAIVFLDLPLLRHYWWAAKRQVECIFAERQDWVDGCPMLPKTWYIARIIRAIHVETRPKILRLLERYRAQKIVFHIRSIGELSRFAGAYC